MGLDINIYVELNIDGKWRPYETQYKYDEKTKLVRPETARYGEIYRNYALFGMLSNTRNDFEMDYISEPRGFPDDMSPETAAALTYYYKYYDIEEPDINQGEPSYITLQELKAFYNKHKKLSITGYISEKSLQEIAQYSYYSRRDGDLTPWAISKKKPDHEDVIYIKKTWKSEVLKETIEKIELYLGDVIPHIKNKNIRLIFWYD